jgi:predicted nucleic acid-binding protein
MKQPPALVLVDTSYWIEHQRGSPQGRPLNEMLRAGVKPAGTEPIRMELLAGTRSTREHSAVIAIFQSLNWIKIQANSDFDGAARIYLEARKSGLTPGGLIDALIVVIALRSKSSLMTLDRNQMDLARLVGVEVVP